MVSTATFKGLALHFGNNIGDKYKSFEFPWLFQVPVAIQEFYTYFILKPNLVLAHR